MFNNSSLLSILMHGIRISNGFIFFDEGHIYFSYSTSANQYGSLTCIKYKNFYLPSADRMRIEFLQLRHTKHWVVVWVSIYNCNCEKSSFSKQGRHGMINVPEDEVEPSSLIHCIYIIMKKLMYSHLIGNLSISILIAFNQLGSLLRNPTYFLVSFSISSHVSRTFV